MKLSLRDERLDQLLLFIILAQPVKIQQVVRTQSMGASHKTVYRNIRLQRTGGANAQDLQTGQFRFDGTGAEVDIDQRIKFIHDNIDIVGTDTRRQYGKPFGTDPAGMAHKLAVLVPAIDPVKMLAYFSNSAGVAHGDDGVRQFIGVYIEVVNGTTGIDYQFGWGNLLHK